MRREHHLQVSVQLHRGILSSLVCAPIMGSTSLERFGCSGVLPSDEHQIHTELKPADALASPSAAVSAGERMDAAT